MLQPNIDSILSRLLLVKPFLFRIFSKLQSKEVTLLAARAALAFFTKLPIVSYIGSTTINLE